MGSNRKKWELKSLDNSNKQASLLFSECINEILKEFQINVFEEREKALTTIGNIVVKDLENASPIGAENVNHFRTSWLMKEQYKGVRYVGNSKTVTTKDGSEPPLSNILEYSHRPQNKHRGFILKTVTGSYPKIRSTFIDEMKKGLKE